MKRIDEWSRKHPSDHSGFHHRQSVLKLWIAQEAPSIGHILRTVALSSPLGDLSRESMFWSTFRQIEALDRGSCSTADLPQNLEIQIKSVLRQVLREFTANTNMLQFYPGHESIWCHRRFLLNLWTGLLVVLFHFDQSIPKLLDVLHESRMKQADDSTRGVGSSGVEKDDNLDGETRKGESNGNGAEKGDEDEESSDLSVQDILWPTIAGECRVGLSEASSGLKKIKYRPDHVVFPLEYVFWAIDFVCVIISSTHLSSPSLPLISFALPFVPPS